MWSRQEQQPVHTMVSGSKRARVGRSRETELLLVTWANAGRPWLRSHSQSDWELWPGEPLLRMLPVNLSPSS